MTPIRNRALGAIYGQLAGDALGCRYEFKSGKMASKMIDKDLVEENGKPHLPILGGGPFSLTKGMVTDDSEMAMGLLRTLVAHETDSTKPDHNPNAKEAYRRWYFSSPPDIGITTRVALDSGVPSKTSLSNGALMRCSPLAIFGVGERKDRLIDTVREDVYNTHSNEIVQQAVCCYVVTLKCLIEGHSKESAVDAGEAVVKDWLVKAWLKSAREGTRLPVLLSDGQPTIYVDGQKQGYIGFAFQLAFYELLHGTSMEQSMQDVLRLGGDTDTNGCIVAALLGGYYGLSNIPCDWVVTVSNPDRTGYDRSKEYPDVDTSDVDDLVDKLLARPGAESVAAR